MAEAETPEDKAAQEKLLRTIEAANSLIHACKEALLYGVHFPERRAVDKMLVVLPDPEECPVFR